MGIYHSLQYTPSVRFVGSEVPPNLPAPPEVEPRRLRRSGRLRASPTMAVQNHGLVPSNGVHPAGGALLSHQHQLGLSILVVYPQQGQIPIHHG